jgi:hypothetical protein
VHGGSKKATIAAEVDGDRSPDLPRLASAIDTMGAITHAAATTGQTIFAGPGIRRQLSS